MQRSLTSNDRIYTVHVVNIKKNTKKIKAINIPWLETIAVIGVIWTVLSKSGII